MTLYYINLILILVLSYPFCIYKQTNVKKAAYLIITFGYMWFLATFRYGIGFDYFSYINIFENIKSKDTFTELLFEGHEVGFVFLTKTISLFTSNHTIMYGVYTFIILVPIVWFIYKYSKNIWLSTWLYVTLAFFYGTMNLIRQSMAYSITIIAYKFLYEKKPIPYFITILIAATFHKTALIMIPIYFLAHIKITKKSIIIYTIITIITYLSSQLFLEIVMKFIFSSYKDTVYLTGFSVAYLIVPFLLFGLCLAFRFEEDKLLLNLMLIATIIWLFITRYFIIERLANYMYIYAIIAIPASIQTLMPKENIKLSARIIKEKKQIYWSTIIAVILITYTYISISSFIVVGDFQGVHGVFPYQSKLF